MVLRPTTSPPQARTPPAKPPLAPTPTITKPIALQPPKPFQVYNENAEQESLQQTGFLEKLKVPTVVLETPSISHRMAAALSLSLLAHTLFLKNQVPFPIAQLSRMPGGKSNPKVAKKRDELIETFDTLASHLQTTFVALSTAYARCKSASSQSHSSSFSTCENDDPEGERCHVATAVEEGRRGTAHLMFVLGTSVGAARARILLTIDGLEVKVWGARASVPSADDAASESEGDSSQEEEDSDEDSAEEDSGPECSEEGSDAEDSVSESEEEEEDVVADTDEGSDSDSGPPSSRSPSPESPPTRSLAPSPESLPSPPIIPTPLPVQQTFTFSVPPSRPAAASENRPPTPSAIAAPPPPPPPRASRGVTPTPELSYAEEQQALRAAERLLSRTLMNAWVNGEGDMSSELAPTQTQIYLRAPRRFVHSAWAARQNLTRSLDGVLDAFLEDAGAVPVPTGAKKAKSRGVRTEGAWIGCRGGSAFVSKAAAGRVEDGEGEGEEDADEDEEDEEIWWVWQGKIVGFADW
ncbi:hypothetical protein L226DRAFT_493122 [Lentinus tigrinus ALCF2SS1-7]|uniref:Uncharacterized protein n=1 Tax=Lentinus tigrinus ALCF2SS1-6 TaxID=1328759 RepID=A0A5C2RV48_9APHY|nr:hypothetical protein L227DRAFT_533619 [Lentinus tigrinus ALCF2SS1-6]RPD70367.1 hypothetical protein L226DRAFT_493122 [Lentinus tigrinus ALCF2SS1-7]